MNDSAPSDTTPKNDIHELRGELFATLRALRDPANPLDIERAKAISDMAQTIINSAKVEVDYRKLGETGSKFIPDEKPAIPAVPGAPRLVRGRDMRG